MSRGIPTRNPLPSVKAAMEHFHYILWQSSLRSLKSNLKKRLNLAEKARVEWEGKGSSITDHHSAAEHLHLDVGDQPTLQTLKRVMKSLSSWKICLDFLEEDHPEELAVPLKQLGAMMVQLGKIPADGMLFFFFCVHHRELLTHTAELRGGEGEGQGAAQV